jgi:hypothetical protein
VTGREAMAARSAIEALRAGVPNRAAIRLLGTNEDALNEDFAGRLRLCHPALRDSAQLEGIVIAGDFGAGKSHQLGYMRELAQQQNFVVSLVPISQETPLFDPARLFAAAIRAAAVPDINDDAMTAAMSRLQPNAGPYDALESWTNDEVRQGRLSALFAALLHLIPRRTADPEDHARIGRFFGGGKLSLMIAKAWLRDAGAAGLFELKPVREADLALQRLRFVPRLWRAAGYAGWCVLLDEVELIGRYGPLQRGRSYAELARWLGLGKSAALPGLFTVAAVTSDFNDEMFDRRHDNERVPELLENRGMLREAAMAKRAIEWLERRQSRLKPPAEDGLRRSLEKIAGLYRDAFDWLPPRIELGQVSISASMRQYVKSWITIWDIARLYGETPSIEAGTIATDYSESSDIEQVAAPRDEDSGAL